jgi:citrate lyase subunit beta / citryl-CoA lyase
MRSMLFVPGDDPKKLAKSIESGSDALIIDLEDSVAHERKSEARRVTLAFLRGSTGGQARFVRINPLSTSESVDDLAAVVAGSPDGIVLPKCRSADDIRAVDHFVTALEARDELPRGRIKLLPIVTETADGMFTLGGYTGSSPRLCGMMWGCEDLSADVGASENRHSDTTYLSPFELARSLCLYAAAAAGVAAIDTVFTDFRDSANLEREAVAAERVGFTAKAAIHPTQIGIINRAFTPAQTAIQWAERVVAAFSGSPHVGVVGIDGKMLDRPHLVAAQRVLQRAGAERRR